MKTVRAVLALLLIIPLGISLYYLFHTGSYWPERSSSGEIFFLIFGLPILLLNYFAWDTPAVIEEMFLTRNSRAIDQGHILCTYCSADKDKTDGLLPANKRYMSERISRVEELAKQTSRRFCILSGEFGLLESDQPIPWYDHRLLPEEAPALVKKVATQLAEKNIKQIDYYARSLELDPNTAPYNTALEAACAKAGVALKEHTFE